MPLDDRDPAVPAKTADEMRAEFRTAQRRRLAERGVAFWRETDFPEQGIMWVDSPPAKKVE